MKIRLIVAAGAALLLGGCGGDTPPTDEGRGAPVAESTAPVQSSPEAAPPPAPPRSSAAPARSPSQVPTAADSAAALAEDVSPEWKMRSRQREPYTSCIEKTVNAPADVRPTLVQACNRLPDAPG